MPAPITPVEPELLKAAASVIERGGIVALPFERLFGLATNALDKHAVERLLVIKGRNENSPISVIIPSMSHLSRVVANFPSQAQRLANIFWPGPLTMLLQAKPNLPERLVSSRGLIGVRLAGPCPAMDLAVLSDKILTATSANKSGEPDPINHTDITGLNSVDLLIPGQVQGPPGSTIVDLTGDSPAILRLGALDVSKAIREASNEH